MGARGAKLSERRRYQKNDEEKEEERVFYPPKILVLFSQKVQIMGSGSEQKLSPAISTSPHSVQSLTACHS